MRVKCYSKYVCDLERLKTGFQKRNYATLNQMLKIERDMEDLEQAIRYQTDPENMKTKMVNARFESVVSVDLVCKEELNLMLKVSDF